jgi:hypothetical protein
MTLQSITPISPGVSGRVDLQCTGNGNFIVADERRLTAVRIEGSVVVQTF